MTLSSKYFGFLALWLALAAPVARAETSEAEQIQAALESWVVERAPAEKITGVAAYISFGDPGPAIEALAGKTGPDSQDPPERQNTLFQMGSTSKSFTAAVILKLEAAGKLSLDDPLGKWLPQYPAWRTSASGKRALGVSCP